MRKSKSAVLSDLGKPPASDANIPADFQERDEILRTALSWISRHGVYIPLDVEEDVSISYADDTLEEFRQTVRGWLEALKAAA